MIYLSKATSASDWLLEDYYLAVQAYEDHRLSSDKPRTLEEVAEDLKISLR